MSKIKVHIDDRHRSSLVGSKDEKEFVVLSKLHKHEDGKWYANILTFDVVKLVWVTRKLVEVEPLKEDGQPL